MVTIEFLENKLNLLTAKLDDYAYKKFAKHQESIADQYDEFDDRQMISYYRALIIKAEDLIYEYGFDDIEDNSDMDYIKNLLK